MRRDGRKYRDKEEKLTFSSKRTPNFPIFGGEVRHFISDISRILDLVNSIKKIDRGIETDITF